MTVASLTMHCFADHHNRCDGCSCDCHAVTGDLPPGAPVSFKMHGYRATRYGYVRVFGEIVRQISDHAYLVEVTRPDPRDHCAFVGQRVRVELDNLCREES